MTKYFLKKFDKNLAVFSMEKDYFGQDRIDHFSLLASSEELPDGMKGSEDSLMSWLRHRMIPRNRAFVKEILMNQGLSENDLMGQIDVCMALSVNDPFWVAPAAFEKGWEECNLYSNSFSDLLSLVAFTGYSQTIKELSPSPEMTTNGQLPKMWKRIDGLLFLYKGATDPRLFTNGGKEPFSEYYASQILKHLNINHIPYDLQQFKGQLVSVCENFTNPAVSYVPMGHLVQNNYLRDLMDILNAAGAVDSFADMVFADALILNEDRHYGNFGLLKDNYSNQFIGLAPLFDHGLSLFSRLTDEKLMNETERREFIENNAVSALGIPHKQLVSLFCGRRHLEMLRKMLDFRFERHPLYNLSETRLQIIESWLHQRAKEMMSWIQKKS